MVKEGGEKSKPRSGMKKCYFGKDNNLFRFSLLLTFCFFQAALLLFQMNQRAISFTVSPTKAAAGTRISEIS